MANIRGRDTAPERAVRKIAHRMGLRFRLYRRDLPGRPDLVLPKHRLAIFVHGCFWHQHEGCRYAHLPKTRTRYWETKFARNVERDSENEESLRSLGWNVAVVWECEVGDEEGVRQRLKAAIRSNVPNPDLEEAGSRQDGPAQGSGAR